MVKSVLAENPLLIIKDHFFDSLGKPDLKSGGAHRHDYMTPQDKNRIREEMKRIGMFSCDRRNEKIVYNINVRRIWENLKDENISLFLNRNQRNYRLKNTYRF